MSLNSHLAELVRRHQVLEKQIETELHHPATSDLKLLELKRKKLHLKDEIEKLQVNGQVNGQVTGRANGKAHAMH
jgi:hypothetical protein